MKVQTKTKCTVICFVCAACLMLCGCHEEQSYFMNKKCYYVSIQEMAVAADRLWEMDQNTSVQIEEYAPAIDEAVDYVNMYSTERMKEYVSSGKLAVGMNQKEVLACLHATNFNDGLPVVSKTFNSKYGKYETWIVKDSSGGQYISYTPPKYTLDFTCFILTDIHEL